ncbi:MAG: HesA/MoeB/ThiF family protein, partial [Bacteriovoracaceae bacterium]|nr:HesA/MoeB/ThiF family protein [Bacteriovoracaceae bacterium]
MSKRDYYSRQTILKEVGEEGQLKISNSKVLIIGAGGLGHPVATYLASAGFGEIAILDFDKVEESNLNRQVCFTLEDLGKFKAEILGLRVKKQNPYIKVSSIVEKLTPINVNKIMNQFDMVIDCCDNFATKYLLHDAAWFLKKDLVQASIYQYEGQVQVFNYSKNS